MAARKATVTRDTLETRITVSVNLDGSGKTKFDTGIPFLEHMLDQVARHGMVDLNIKAKGDLHIDDHHTVEDTIDKLSARSLKVRPRTEDDEHHVHDSKHSAIFGPVDRVYTRMLEWSMAHRGGQPTPRAAVSRRCLSISRTIRATIGGRFGRRMGRASRSSRGATTTAIFTC